MYQDFSTLSPKQLLRQPAIALLLGVLPFWLFVGASSSTTINGQVVQQSHFNVLGLVLAGIGLAMAVRLLWGDFQAKQNWLPRTGLAILAALVCLAQLGYSVGLYSF
jgi:hypothetical protein